MGLVVPWASLATGDLDLLSHLKHNSSLILYHTLMVLNQLPNQKLPRTLINSACPYTLQPWCRLVTAAYNYFHVTNFFWMFGEGCYLHTAIVLTYSTDKLRKWMFICLGWCEWQGEGWERVGASK